MTEPGEPVARESSESAGDGGASSPAKTEGAVAERKSVPGDAPMALFDHLEALRTHLLRGGKYVLIAFAVCFYFADELVAIAVVPHQTTMRALGEPETLSVLSYQEYFITSLKLALFAALFVGLPMLLRELWSFISVGLFPEEKKYVRYLTPLITVSFVLGVLFGFFIMVPVGLRFLAVYGDRSLVQLTIRLSDYMSLFLTLTIALGVIFELPLVMWSLVRIGIIKVDQFVGARKFAVLGAVVGAALLTPPDVITQLLMAGPLVVLYELGILLTGGWRKTAGGGKVILVLGGAIVILFGLLVYDLWRVDFALARYGSEGNELAFEGGGDRPFTPLPRGAAANLVDLAERAARPTAARAAEDPELVPLAVTLASLTPADPHLRPFLRDAAEDERAFVRDRVARALGNIADPADAGILERLRTDPEDRAVRVTAAVALLEQQVPAGAFTLIKMLESGPEALQAAALEALVAARDGAAPEGADTGSVDAWWDWYHGTLARRPSTNALGRVDVLEQLAARGGDALVELQGEMLRLLEDEDPRVRERTTWLLPPALLRRTADDPDPTVRLAGGRAMIVARDYEGIPQLIALVGDVDAVVSRMAHVTLRDATRLDFPEDRATWERWWQDNAGAFRWR